MTGTATGKAFALGTGVLVCDRRSKEAPSRMDVTRAQFLSCFLGILS